MEMNEQTPLSGEGEELAGIHDTVVRHGFVRKVYGILSMQLIVTTAIAAGTMRYALQLRQTNPAAIPIVMTFSIAVTISTMLVFLCCPQTMRKSPTNYVLLSLFTVAESFMVGFICVQYTAQSVLVTFAVTSVVVVALSIFACQTKYDITGFMPYFLMATMVLFGFGFALSIAAMCGASQTGAFQTLNLVYAAGGALLFSGYIIMDTQLIVGGKHQRFRFCIDDYCMAAITIYLDIVQLFLFLLRLLGDVDAESVMLGRELGMLADEMASE
eukprot:CAMPEP_0181409908 /NCGR_PEP_ID=MMETSP1110-20121109/7066_1 /TAXON_ID=174948 /ORGANISM="Symbiodinium sp., Strain CCMP421" /LENGTH=270 /DNA_ID=CAMNT_0023532439 /DNA_START=40 /DNA_END=853 /DNA_ORIENTATION=-